MISDFMTLMSDFTIATSGLQDGHVRRETFKARLGCLFKSNQEVPYFSERWHVFSGHPFKITRLAREV